ncbi:MAG: tetratricopeptide repeat protein [Candidatus Melainabacteria bacterium]|nr:tetratricopeptide repeat protein [Candidatus Melainabacteria bacterium]
MNFGRKNTKTLALMAILIVFSGQALPCNSSELSGIKQLTPTQQAVWDEQEELYDRFPSTPPGQYPNLIERLQNLLKKQEVAFGPDSPQVSCTLDQLWAIYQLQKNPEPQITVARRSMEIKRKILGPQAIDTTMALCHLANSLAANKQYDAALALLQNYLKTLVPTETRSAETMTIYEIAQTYFEWNKFDEAQPWFDKTIDFKLKYAPNSRVYPSYRKALLAQRANKRLARRFRTR